MPTYYGVSVETQMALGDGDASPHHAERRDGLHHAERRGLTAMLRALMGKTCWGVTCAEYHLSGLHRARPTHGGRGNVKLRETT